MIDTLRHCPERPHSTRPTPLAWLGGNLRGFTLIEMLVSVSITTVLLLLVSRVFNDTTRTIADSMDVSQVLATSRVMSDQLFDDGSRIITAKANEVTQVEKLEQPGGFLVIVQQRNEGVRFPDIRNGDRPGDTSTWTADADGDGIAGEAIDDLIRTDQFFFFREGTRVESLTPADASRYDSDARGTFIRVWYGHVAPPVFNAGGNLVSGPEPGIAPNDSINALTVGRQGLIIIDNAGKDPVSGQNITIGSVNNSAVLLDARNTDYNLGWNVDTDENVVNSPAGDPEALWTGVTDVMTFAHDGIDQLPTGSGWFFQDLFDIDSGVAPENTDGQFQLSPYTTNNTSGITALDGDLLPTADYARAALTWGFLREDNRLVASSDIEYPFANAGIARTHAFFAPYVSDFAVEFAADIQDDLGNTAAEPLEYDVHVNDGGNVSDIAGALPASDHADGTPDTVTAAEALGVANLAVSNGYINALDRDDFENQILGSIKWYTADHLVNNPAFDGTTAALYETGFYPAFDSRKPITWPIPQGATLHSGFTAYPPYVGWYKNGGTSVGGTIVTPDGALPTVSGIAANVNSRAAFVFGHTGDADYNNGVTPSAIPPYPASGAGDDADSFEVGSAKWWPYMLRVRYRLHDGDGSFGSVDSITNERIAGKWFEQIIAVPRK